MARLFKDKPSFRVAPEPRRIVPALIEIAPLKLLPVEFKAKTPAPDLVIALVPTIADSRVIVPRVLFAVIAVLPIDPFLTVASTAPDKVKVLKVLAVELVPRSKTGLAPATPETVTGPANVPAAPRPSVPALIVVLPVKLLLELESTKVPLPDLVRVYAPPPTAPSKARVPALTVIILFAIRITAPLDCVRVLPPAPLNVKSPARSTLLVIAADGVPASRNVPAAMDNLPVPKASLASADKVPPFRFTAPENDALAPVKTKVLAPDLVRVEAPERADSILAVPAVASTVIAVLLRVPPKTLEVMF